MKTPDKIAIDALIHARWVIPVEPDDRILSNHAVAINNGSIVALLPSEEATTRYQPKQEYVRDHHVLLPGFINAHTHSAMSLLRGLADDVPLKPWLEENIWPIEQRWMSPEFVRVGCELALVEMVRSGTTCFADMYFFPNVTAKCVVKSGLRAAIGLVVVDFKTAWANDAADCLHKGLAVRDDFAHQPLITTMLAPHAPYTVSDATLEHLLSLAEELGLGIQMHVCETKEEVEQSISHCNMTPLQRLQGLGLLSPQLQAVHMTQITDCEFDSLQRFGVHVIHCPESNLKLGSGICPVGRLLAAGINVALGTDGAASNNDLDMLGEMRTAALLARNTSAQYPVSSYQILQMATINAAKALGLEQEIGSIVPGKKADLIAIDLASPEMQPLYNPLSQIIYAAGRDQVTDVWVEGAPLLVGRTLTTLNWNSIKTEVSDWQRRIGNQKIT